MLIGVETRSISPVFVGRDDELEELTAALARAHAGEPQFIVVGGEAGVGKTRLLEEFAAAACAEGACLAVGGCLELGADGLPFAPFATALRALHLAVGDELTEAVAGREAELARLLPDLGPAVPASHDMDSRARLFELTARLLEQLAAKRTVVLALEDLHWADRSTRELLGYLVRSVQRSRLVVIATYRSDDVDRRHPLRPFLAELDRLRSVRRLELSRLTPDEVRRQVAGIRGTADPDRATVAEIYARSEGNPFFVEELSLSCDGPGELSDSLRDLLLVRVEALPEPAQRVVRIAARTTRVEHELLQRVSGLTEDELIEGLRAAVGANVLVPQDEGSARGGSGARGGEAYRFRHALLREAVLDDLLPGERTRLSRRYAEVLEADPSLVRPEERAARLASYWYYARDAAKALPVVLEAITDMRERHAYAEQVQLLERAMELWDEVPEEIRAGLPPLGSLESYPPCGCRADQTTLELHFLDLLAEASVASRLDGQQELGLAFVKKALKIVDGMPGGDRQRAAWFWMQWSRLLTGLGRGDGWPELAKALELVSELPPSPLHADVLAHTAAWQMVRASDEGTFELASRAVEMARETGAEEVELHARITLATVRSRSGDTDAWIAELRQVRELALRIGVPRTIMRALNNLPDALHRVGRPREAVQEGLAGMEEMRRRGLSDGAAFSAANVAESMIALGDWDEAQNLLTAWRPAASSSGSQTSIVLRLAEIALARGEFTDVPPLLAAAHAHRWRNDRIAQWAVPVAIVEMRCAAHHGRYADALGVLNEILDRLPMPGQDGYVWQLLAYGAGLAADAAGLPGLDPAALRALTVRLEAEARHLTEDPALPLHHVLRAELARARGTYDLAALTAAAELFAPLANPYADARLAYRRAEALLETGGDRAEAGRLLTAAWDGADSLGAAPLREDVERLASRARLPLKDRSAPAPAADTLGLTARERDVLRLVAAGRSNRQIAEELFISPKTASVHVSNLMAKLGVSGRGEAAALAHRLRLFEDLAEA
ncbi:AAA family ATPase [Streptomyces sp. NPDC051940]|uniref:helix-turn-helix transcriptional regulator n=1 Tax=Streptomyces sp. NPDC051940 TaxID=3155675 RepID=UPI0034258664